MAAPLPRQLDSLRMPAATDEQVPKPLTYTLMYHGLWCAMFLLSAFGLSGLFFASGVGFLRALLAPWPLLALALAAGLGLFATYAVRIQVLLGEFDKLVMHVAGLEVQAGR